MLDGEKDVTCHALHIALGLRLGTTDNGEPPQVSFFGKHLVWWRRTGCFIFVCMCDNRKGGRYIAAPDAVL